MRRAVLLAVVSALAAVPLAPSAAGGRQRIAVLDIRAVQGVSPGSATILTAIVVDDAARGGYDVISQADVSAMIGFEKQKQMLGCGEDSSCLAEIGGALGVDFVLSGQVGQIGSRFHLSFQLLDSRKGKVVARTAKFSDRNEDDLANAAQQCVAELLTAARNISAPRVAAPVAPPEVKPEPPPPPPPPAKVPAATNAPLVAAAPRPDLAARPFAAPPVEPIRSASVRPFRTAAWITLGAGVALIGGGVVSGLKAKSERDALANAWAEPGYPGIYDSKSKAAKSAALVANVCYLAGGAATGVSGWLFWRSRAPAFSIAPAVEDGRFALVAGGSF